MTPQATCTTDVSHAYVLRVEDIERITSLLEERLGHVSVEIDCADNIVRKFPLSKEVKQFENDRRRQATNVIIRARSNDNSQSATVRFSNRAWGPISLSVEGSETEVEQLRARLLIIIDGMKPWYARFAHFDFLGWGLGGLVLLIVGAKFVVAIGWHSPSTGVQSDPAHEARMELMAWLIPLAVVVIGIVLNKLRNTVFPLSVFAIGQGRDRHDVMEKVRWGVVIASILGILRSVFVSRLGLK